MDTEKQGRDGLLDLHALELNFLGQPRQRVLDPVVREHEGRVDIRANLEDYIDRKLAISARLAGNIVHFFDTVDGLLQRRCDGAGDRLGRSAGIESLNLGGWRDD